MPEAEGGRITLWAIEIFLATVEEGAVSAAARRLGVSPSAVSQQLNALESALGTALIDRSLRPVAITPAGSMFRRHARVMLNAAEEARAELTRTDLAGLTLLRMGVIEDFEADVTPRLLGAMAEQLPNCRFLLETGPSHRLLDQLEARGLDLVVTADLSEEVSPEHELHPLLLDPFIALRPKGRDIADLPLIRYSARHLMGRSIDRHLAQHGIAPGARFEMDSYAAILAMVAAGQGWTILTPLALHHTRGRMEGVEPLPLPYAPLTRQLSLRARAGTMGDVPARVAAGLRRLITTEVIAPAVTRWPWMEQGFRLVEPPGTTAS